MGYPEHLIQVEPRDLGPYKDGGTGIDYVHTFDSGVDGPHVMINSINKGNEICGSEAVATLLDNKLRPRRGKLTLSFANVGAYETLDVRNPAPAKFLDINFNRIWDDRILDDDSDAYEIRRARDMRPVIRQVDYLLDLLSDCFYRAPDPWFDPPLLSYVDKPAARAMADKIAYPLHHIGCGTGGDGDHTRLLFEYDRFSDPNDPAVGLLAECGPHFATESIKNSLNAAARFLLATGTIDAADAAPYGALEKTEAFTVYTDMKAPGAKTDAFKWAGTYHGHNRFNKGDLVATDGDVELRAPYDDCVLITVNDDVKAGQGIGHFIRQIS